MEKVATHTPGPWCVDEQGERFDIMHRPPGPKGSPHYHITTLWAKDEHSDTDQHFSIGRTRADASLMAAAPDLLAACEALVASFRYLPPVIPAECADALNAASAIIAKAKGEA